MKNAFLYTTMGPIFRQASSVGAYVDYLEKEDLGKHPDLKENFYDQYNDRIAPEKVISEIEGNTAKLRKPAYILS